MYRPSLPSNSLEPSGLLKIFVPSRPLLLYPPLSFPVTEMDIDDESVKADATRCEKEEGEEDGKRKDSKDSGRSNAEEIGTSDPRFTFTAGADGTIEVVFRTDSREADKRGKALVEEFYKKLQYEEKKFKEERVLEITAEMEVLAKKYMELGSGQNAERVRKSIVNVLMNM